MGGRGASGAAGSWRRGSTRWQGPAVALPAIAQRVVAGASWRELTVDVERHIGPVDDARLVAVGDLLPLLDRLHRLDQHIHGVICGAGPPRTGGVAASERARRSRAPLLPAGLRTHGLRRNSTADSWRQRGGSVVRPEMVCACACACARVCVVGVIGCVLRRGRGGEGGGGVRARHCPPERSALGSSAWLMRSTMGTRWLDGFSVLPSR